MSDHEYYVDADKIRVMRTPKGSTYGNDQRVVALCATDAGGMDVAVRIAEMLNGSSAGAPQVPCPDAARYDRGDCCGGSCQRPFGWIVGSVERKVANTVYFDEAHAIEHYESTKGVMHNWVKVEPIYAAPALSPAVERVTGKPLGLDEAANAVYKVVHDYAVAQALNWQAEISKLQAVAPVPQTAVSTVEPVAWQPLPYETPRQLWEAFKGGAKFNLHYHGKVYGVTGMEPRNSYAFVQPPGLPVKVRADGSSAEGSCTTIWLAPAPTTSPEPDAVREEIARIVDPESWRWRDAISSIGPVEYVYSTRAQQDRVWLEECCITTPAEITEWCKKQNHSLSRGFVRSLEQADAILAALTRPAHGGWETTLKALLDHVDRETCTHEETHRGGAIWTICDCCGRKWADDEGGFKPHCDAPAVANARSLLARNDRNHEAG